MIVFDRDRDLVLGCAEPVQLGLGLLDGVGAEKPGLVAGPTRAGHARCRHAARARAQEAICGFHMGR